MANKTILARNIVKKFRDAISGDDREQWINKSPEETIYIGKLSPTASGSENSSNVLIQQISMIFRVSETDIENAIVQIHPQGNFFYRVMPTLEQQQEFMLSEAQKTFKDLDIKDFSDLLRHAKAKKLVSKVEGKDVEFKVPLLPIYEKTAIDKDDISFSIRLKNIIDPKTGYGYIKRFEGDGEGLVLTPFYQEIEDHLTRLADEISQTNAIRFVFRNRIAVSDIVDDDSWKKYIEKSRNSEEFDSFQRFRYSLTLDVKKAKDFYDVTVAIINETQFGSEEDEKNGDSKDRYRISTLFNSGIKVYLLNAGFLPIELDYFVDDYKYDRNVFALGNNCNVTYDKTDKTLSTTHLPLYEQFRLKTNDKIKADFASLIKDPIKVLENIKAEMFDELKKWNQKYDELSSGLTAGAKKTFQKEISDFKIEIDRFVTGIKLIKDYNIIKDAFIYMNQSFMNSAKGYDSWRLFQIVFIVSLILDIVANDSDLGLDDDLRVNKAKTDEVDILYFPTGGGKTEAFLGIIVFNLFFDRIRGKKYGVTAILKYPLRLLSIQQVQRLANILASAELIRREKIGGKFPFSLGYYTGDGNTPNRISKQEMQKYADMPQEQLNAERQILDRCPFCGRETLFAYANVTDHKFEHRCSNPECESKGVLPLYIVDQELFRFLPSVVISTVDKLAAIGNNRAFRNLLCGAEKYCPVHGFIAGNKCLVEGCETTVDDFKDIKIKDPAPTLMIQDELHLIKESLGAFDAHYETFIDYFIREFNVEKRGIKIIGATATITQCEAQIEHLYCKSAIRFPCASPYVDRNFYSFIDESELNRIMIGYAPFGKAIIHSVVYAMQYLRRIIVNLYENPQEIIDMDGMTFSGTDEEKEKAAKDLMEDYWMMLQYNNVKMDSNKVISAIDDPVNTQLIAEGISPLRPEKMTGDDKFQDVRKLLSKIEHSNSIIKDLDDTFNLITATSMISHGVDADRFNLMLFYGMPGNTAEYIQAYSRVGRKHVGIVIDIMRPAREKDQSYLKMFNKFHEYKDILVDSVPINRWATKTIDCTFPGIVSGLIINYFSHLLGLRLDLPKTLKETVIGNQLKIDEVKAHLYKIYRCDDKQIGKLYKARIDALTDKLFEDLRTRQYGDINYITGWFEKLGFKVMTSLRDTDTQLNIELQ